MHFSHSTAFAFPPAADDSHTDDISAEHSGNIPDERREAIREWREVMGALRGSPEDATLFSLYHDPRDNDFVNDAGFDGAYSYFASDGFTRGSSSSLWSLSSRHLAEHGKAFVPSVGPGYDDTAIRPWNVQNTKSRQDGHYYDQMWKAALEISPPHITITSYNEWGEGEPFFFPAASSSRALALVSPRSWAPFFGPVLWPRFQTRLRFQTPTLLLRMQAHRLSRLRPFSLYILFFLRMQAHRLSRLSPSLYTFNTPPPCPRRVKRRAAHTRTTLPGRLTFTCAEQPSGSPRREAAVREALKKAFPRTKSRVRVGVVPSSSSTSSSYC